MPLRTTPRVSLLALLGMQLLCCFTVVATVNPQVGFTYRYSFSTMCMSAGKDVRGANDAGAQAPHTAQLVAEISVLSRDGEYSVCQLALANVSAHIVGGEAEARETEWDRLLGEAVSFVWRSDGRIEDFRFSPQDTVWGTNLKRGVLSALQLTLSAEGSYSSEEEDFHGATRPSYSMQRRAKTGALHFVKSVRSHGGNAGRAIGAEGADGATSLEWKVALGGRGQHLVPRSAV
ncbi:hypothetical protein T484DRAFT_1858918 [Baffinella frigidus]|nr:hypothetical protein T484DRAFT_1858918 [Cryptophyta sp. CCMP2293]